MGFATEMAIRCKVRNTDTSLIEMNGTSTMVEKHNSNWYIVFLKIARNYWHNL